MTAPASTNACTEMKGKVMHVMLQDFMPQEKTAEKSLRNMEKYHVNIAEVGNGKCVAPAVIIAGIIFQESHAGAVLKDGWGDHGNAFGLVQLQWNNAEANNVQNYNKMDTGTTHNYANNVDARANFCKRIGY
ncbi:LOW QUALITY PROTEIN: lysozyme g-like protein 2 [Myiozetetes cayanensis]|uniref:LOW QUALITY PROTEIN: lysozyme g-like protein 2 n=1 Tax=Myiozetetes cayanensis TaxID=478635 RepID=UPI00215EFD5B|nr:LOW QUALITY PROTEIN: lysozyme g-like protein 2 [Myiozetetes cayanensis]